MKRIKKIISVMLAMVMALAMCSSVFATGTDATDAKKDSYTITMNGKTTGHTYAAYQVFTGDLATKEGSLILSNIDWGNGVKNVEALVEELAGIKESGIEAGMSASDIAEILKEESDNSDLLQKFTDIIGKSEYLGVAAGESEEGDNCVYTIEVANAGYYFVKDTGDIVETATATDYILEVVGDAQVNTKDDVVELDKEIVSGNQYVSSNTAGIGDNVTYRLSSKVPDHSAYSRYYFIMNDTLSAGLDFNNDPVVTIDGVPLERGKDYYIYEGEDDQLLEEDAEVTSRSFKIAFTNIKNYTPEALIYVTYSARLNEDAVIGEHGNTNKANLTYSNDPNYSGNGDPGDEDEKPGIPDSDKKIPTGSTPEIVVVTFTTQVEIYKTQNGSTTALEGAEFTLTGISKQTVLKGGDQYTKDSNGDYWQLKDGTYTTEAPQTTATMEEASEGATAGYVVAEDGYTGEDAEVIGDITYRPVQEGDTGTVYIKIEPNESAYASTTVKFAKIVASENTVTEKYVSMVGTSDANGQIIFKGLGEGEFTITETQTPAGFNTALPIKVVITGKISGTGAQATCEWSVGAGSEGAFIVQPLEDDSHSDDIVDEYYVNIVNNSGSTLPSTGGIGTTIFYIIGGILVVGAAILLVTKKRMSGEA